MGTYKLKKYTEIKVKSVIQILRELQKVPSSEMFRGQSDSRWPLIPKLGRLFSKSKIPDTWERIESIMLTEFQQYAIPHINREPRNKFEWLVLGQHYGLPTRLLDWTTNPLKATFWAVNDSEKKCDGALFCFCPQMLISDLDESESIDDIDYIMPIYPKMIDSRIIAQEACLIPFPFPKAFKPFAPLENESIHGDSYHHLVKMIIPHEFKATILYDIHKLGANSKALFPDLSGLAEFIETKWKRRWD